MRSFFLSKFFVNFILGVRRTCRFVIFLCTKVSFIGITNLGASFGTSKRYEKKITKVWRDELNSVPTSLSLNFKPFPNHIQIQVQQIIVLKHIRAENYTKALQCWKEQIENLCSTKTVTIFEISFVVIFILKEWIY